MHVQLQDTLDILVSYIVYGCNRFMFYSCSISFIIVLRQYQVRVSRIQSQMKIWTKVFYLLTAQQRKVKRKSRMHVIQGLLVNKIDYIKIVVKLVTNVDSNRPCDMLHTLSKVYLKEKLMKALLIIIPLTTALLMIVLVAKRKREALYRKRRKFWLQGMSKSIQYAA